MVSSSDGQAETTIERLIAATGGKSVSSLAGVLGTSPQAIYNARNKGNIPKAWYIVVAEATGVSADWLLTGKGSKQREEDYSPHFVQAINDLEERDLVMVPKVRARLSAGNGSLETSAEVKARYAFRREWIRAKGQPAQMVLMDVAGDSMEPDIRDKDVVLIDQSQADVIAGAVYAVGIDDAVLIKYLDKEPGTLILRSANKDYRPIEVDLKDESQNVRIIGRVVWWCREAR